MQEGIKVRLLKILNVILKIEIFYSIGKYFLYH